MLVVEMPPEILRLGQPAPVSVRDAQGQLLIRKGTMVATEEQRQRLVSRTLYVDESEGEQIKRIQSGQLDALLRQNVALGKMARSQTDASGLLTPKPVKKPLPTVQAWADLQMRTDVLVRDPPPADFPARLFQLQEDLQALLESEPDEALLILVHLMGGELHQRHATQTLLTTVVCELTTLQLGSFSAEERLALRCAALTRHIGMAAVQDQLALQEGPLSAAQADKVQNHGLRAIECLREAGISDPLWFDLLELHHQPPPPGPMAGLPPAWQLARLLERSARFVSQLGVRKNRPAPAAAEAAKATFRHGGQSADDAGALVVTSVGVYPPGSYVRLGSGEVALVLQRGAEAASPKVASLIGRSGSPLVEPLVRDTRRRPHEVAASISPQEVKLRLNLEKLVLLVR